MKSSETQLSSQQESKIIAIALKAQTLKERLIASKSLEFDCVYSHKSRERWQKWQQIAAKTNSEQFHRRLSWDKLDNCLLLSLLEDSVPNLELKPPSWLNIFKQVMEIAQNNNYQNCNYNLYFIPNKPAPFETFYLPFLQVARQQIQSKNKAQWELLTTEAQLNLFQGLLSRLSQIAVQTLIHEFSQYRGATNSLRDILLVKFSLEPSSQKYDSWLNQLLSNKIWDFFEKYSVLARLLSTALEFWIESTTEFLHYLEEDWPNIQQSYSPETVLEKVVTCQCNLSDYHHRGRSVIIITFNTELKLVYKPRNLQLEVAFFDLVNWCNQQQELLPLPCLKILNYHTHGWTEYVTSLSCEDESGIRRFFHKSGLLLCLVYLLEGIDFHAENLIAQGEDPILIDIEALLNNRMTSPSTTPKQGRIVAQQQLAESVFKTSLLPRWGILPNDSIKCDLGGIGTNEEEILLLQGTWKHINTDSMHLDFENWKNEYLNSPMLKGQTVSVENYITEVMAGFEQMYDFFFSHQSQLLALNTPLKIISDQKVRFVFRNTSTYAAILQRSCHPTVLEYGIDRSISLDVLSRAFSNGKEKPIFWKLLNEEIDAMEQLDIPLFWSNSSSLNLYVSETKIVSEAFTKTSFDRILSSIKELNNSQKQQQINFIKSAFAARFVSCQPQQLIINEAPIENNLINREFILEQVIKIATEIDNHAIHSQTPPGISQRNYHNYDVGWLSLVYKPQNHLFRFQVLDFGLGDGNAGIAIFLAALAHITQDSRWRNLALAALTPLKQYLSEYTREEQKKLVQNLGIGGINGVASIAYSLTQISRLLQEPSLIKQAEKLLSLLTVEQIAACNHINLINGCAGTLLHLLGCLSAGISNPQDSLEKAIVCGDFILKCESQANTTTKQRITGFWEGIGGVAYSLLRLYEITQDNRYLTTAQNAIACEANLCKTQDNSTSFQQQTEITLARLGGLSILDTPEIRAEITAGIAINQKYGLCNVDHLLWGNSARLEMLLTASEKLEDKELWNTVNYFTNQIALKIASNQLSLFSNFPTDVFNPTFLHGTAGIGYQLLRILEPKLLSSVLLCF